ncbi:MAG: hypothetical protein QOJ94_2315 [Sphingomonadales bacterium]|jgi:hypothetical protein|nr:hypothetical protein [Sphingomonadales bacterium]
MFSAFQLILTDNHARARNALTLGAPPPATDRTVDMVVLNQGHGDIGRFESWDAGALDANLVAPMVASGIRANILILDFCLSASLLPAMAPLCAPGGMIVSALYSVSDVVMTSAFWSEIKPNLDMGNIGGLRGQVMDRLRRMAAELTGFANLRTVQGWTEAETMKEINANPNDREFLSIARYLPSLALSLSNATLTLPQLYAQLKAVKDKPALGFAEQQILAALPNAAAAFDAAERSGIETQFSERLYEILTLPKYGLQENVAGAPTFEGDGSLWQRVLRARPQLLALATGLPRCPTPFTVWNESRRALSLDAALALDPIPATAASLIREIEWQAPEDVETILSRITNTAAVSLLDQQLDYLQ